MVVYIEYVIIDNVTFDLVILFLTKKITKLDFRWWQLVLGAVVGTLTALFSPFVGGGVMLFLYKTFSLIAMCLPLGAKNLLKTCLFALLTTFLMGGCLIAFFWFLGVPFDVGTTLTYQSQISFGVYLLAIIFCYFLTWLIFNYAKRNKRLAHFTQKVTIVVADSRWQVVGLLDSGNLLTFQGVAVCFVCGNLAKKMKKVFAKEILFQRATKIYYQTVEGSASTWAIKGVVQRANESKEVYFALSNHQSTHQLILNQAFLEDNNV